jgi:hypothetical protein
MPDRDISSRADTGEPGNSLRVAGEQPINGDLTRQNDRKILARCEALGLPLLKAIQLAVASDPADPYALLRLLDLDFETWEPVRRSRRQRSLWMAARTSSVSYRGTLTEEMLLDLLTGGKVPAGFAAHVGHFLDEAPVGMVVMAVAEAAQRSGTPIQTVWRNLAALAFQHSCYRCALWTRY